MKFLALVVLSLIGFVIAFEYLILWFFMINDYPFLKTHYSRKQILGIALIVPLLNFLSHVLPLRVKKSFLWEKLVEKLIKKICGAVIDEDEFEDPGEDSENRADMVRKECTEDQPFPGQRNENEVWIHVDAYALDEDDEGRFFKCPHCGTIIDLGPDVV